MKHIVITYFFILLPLFLLTQNTDYQVSLTTYTQENGLSNNDVLCINKDTRGVLWVGTRYGLNRFDGRNFRVFTTENGLKSNFVSRIVHIDKRYVLLGLSTPVQGENVLEYQVFDTYNYAFSNLKKRFVDLPFAEKQIYYINYLHGHFVFVLQNGEKYMLSKKKEWKKIDFLDKREQVIAFQPEKYVWGVLKGDKTTILTKYDLKGKVQQRQTIAQKVLEIKWLRTDEAGNDYFAYSNIPPTRVIRISAKGTKEIFTEEGVSAEGITYNPSLKGYWIVTTQKAKLLSENGQLLWEDDAPKNGFVYLGRQNYFETAAVWQCGVNGLSCLTFNQRHFKTIFGNEKESFRAIIRVGNRIFFSTENKLYEKSNDTTAIALEYNSLSSVRASDSTAWFGSYKKIWRLDTKQKKIENYEVFQNEMWGFGLDAEQKLWFSESGVSCFNTHTKQIEEVSHKGFEALKKGIAYYFYPLSKTRAWLCTTTGLYELDTHHKKILKRYWSGGKGEFYLPADDFRHLYQDKKTGEVWIATGQRGLLRWQPKSGASELFPFNSLSTNIMHGVYADDYGFLWLPTDDGIVQWQRKTGRFRVYRTQDGLLTNEFNRISHFQDTDGTLYFGSVRGVAVFHPRDFQEVFERSLQRPPIIVEVQQYNGSKNKVEDKTADFLAQQSLTLNPSDRFFTLTLASPDYSTAKAATYFYQIKGDAIWQKAESNQLTFWRLPYGRQTIFIKAALSDGDFSEVLTVNIFAKPPFYMRWWFLVLVALAVGLAFLLRFRALQRQNTKLEQEVERRTEKIKQQAEELRQLDEMKSRFFANISHELRTPLTLITAPLQQLITQEHSNDKKQLIQFAFNNSQRLLRLVNQILDLTKLGNTKLQIEEKEVLLLPFVHRIVGEFKSFAAHKRIALKLHAEFDENVVYSLDANKVETILYNFLSNALKFTPEGGEVILSLTQTTEGIAFEVTDTGRGIAPEDLPYIFDRFYQSKKQKAAEGGTGIGLALCKELATLLKGNIEVRSKIGMGTTFLFLLPCELLQTKIAPPLELNKIPSSRPVSVATQDERLPHLLLVEDNEDLQHYIAVLLQQDYHLTIANNGKIALDYLHNCEIKNRPTLIISDIMMPEMDGFQLLQHLKSSPYYQKIPIIMLTARASIDDRLKALRIGVDAYLTKPFLEEELLVRIDNLLRNAAIRMDFGTDSDAPESEVPPMEWLKMVEVHILENMKTPTFSVGSVAETFGISRQLFNKRIGQEVGMTALNYIQEVQLNEAKRLLESKTFTSVKEVATKVGFTNPKLFSRKFVERFGKYPSDYL